MADVGGKKNWTCWILTCPICCSHSGKLETEGSGEGFIYSPYSEHMHAQLSRACMCMEGSDGIAVKQTSVQLTSVCMAGFRVSFEHHIRLGADFFLGILDAF